MIEQPFRPRFPPFVGLRHDLKDNVPIHQPYHPIVGKEEASFQQFLELIRRSIQERMNVFASTNHVIENGGDEEIEEKVRHDELPVDFRAYL